MELRCKKPTNSTAVNSTNRLTESSTCENTEEPSAYLEPTLCCIHESDFFTSAPLGDIDDSIADAIDCGRKPSGTVTVDMIQQTGAG